VNLPALKLTALQAAIAAAVSSGAEGLEAAAVVTEAESADPDSIAAVHDLGASAPVFVANPAATEIRTA
jgi:hypothetical protein